MSDWLCDTFGWACADHGEHVTHAAPEIDGSALLLAVVLVVGLILVGEGRRRWKHDDTAR
jgi:hypothetical protein